MPAISRSLNPRIKMFVPEFDRALAPLLLTRIEGWEIFHADVLPRGRSLCAHATMAQSHASWIGLDTFLIVDERTVSPSLGQDSIRSGVLAALAGPLHPALSAQPSCINFPRLLDRRTQVACPPLQARWASMAAR